METIVGDITWRLEIVVGVLFVLKFSLFWMFIRYIQSEIRQYGYQRFRLQAATAIAIKELGNLLVVGWVWLYLYSDDVEWMSETVPVSFIGLTFAAAGCLYMIRVFTPEHCGHMSWIATAVLAAAAAAGLAWFL